MSDPKWHAAARTLASVAFALVAVTGAFVLENAGWLLIVFAASILGTIVFGSELASQWWRGQTKMTFLKDDGETPEGFMPPGAADNMLRQTIQICWMNLPKTNRSIDALEAEMKRLFERAFANLREDERREQE